MFIWPQTVSEGVIRSVVSALFITSGFAHFTRTDFFISIMPPMIPYPYFWVYFTGICEIVGAIGLWFASWSVAAAWGLIFLCIGVFPANLYMAMMPERFSQFSITALYMRLPMQLVLIYVLFWLASR